jgi:hypothetical protein
MKDIHRIFIADRKIGLETDRDSHQILRYVWRPPSFMRGRKNELEALAAFIITVDRIEGWNKP